jgi:hypothetical protein
LLQSCFDLFFFAVVPLGTGFGFWFVEDTIHGRVWPPLFFALGLMSNSARPLGDLG